VNTAVVLLTSVLMPGADPMPAAQPAPVVVAGQGGCSTYGAGPVAYSSRARQGPLDRLKAKHARSSCDGGYPQPAPGPQPAPYQQPNLVDHMKTKLARKRASADCEWHAAAPAAAPVPVNTPPADAKPVPGPKVGTKTGVLEIPVRPVEIGPGLTVVPQAPITPKLNGPNSPY
jgi:hypothetical protein